MSRDRGMKRIAAKELANKHPQGMRDMLMPHVEEYCNELLWDMRNRTIRLEREDGWAEVLNPAHRTALDVIPKITRDIGEAQTLVVNLLQTAGARDESHLLEMVQRARSAASISLDQAKRQALEVLKLAIADDPSCESEIRSFLFGRRVEASSAVVMDS